MGQNLLWLMSRWCVPAMLANQTQIAGDIMITLLAVADDPMRKKLIYPDPRTSLAAGDTFRDQQISACQFSCSHFPYLLIALTQSYPSCRTIFLVS